MNGLPSTRNSRQSSGLRSTWRGPLTRLRLYASVAAKTMYLPSGLHVGLLWTRLGIVRPRQRLEDAALAVVDAQNPLDRKEQLREIQIGLGDKDRLVLDRADHEPAVGRDLGEKSEGRLPFAPLVVAPGNDRVPIESHGLLDRRDGIRAFVVGVVDVHPQHGAIGGERVAVPAHGQVFEHNRRSLLRRNRPKPPPNGGRVLHGLRKGQDSPPGRTAARPPHPTRSQSRRAPPTGPATASRG